MLVTKSLNINELTPCNFTNNKPRTWFNIQNADNDQQLSQLYKKLCQQHKHEKKWILVVNPEDHSLEKLASIHGIDASKILRVNISQQAFDLATINNVLSTGNCSAVILSNTTLKENEISQLTYSAQQGQTQCIMLKSRVTLH